MKTWEFRNSNVIVFASKSHILNTKVSLKLRKSEI